MRKKLGKTSINYVIIMLIIRFCYIICRLKKIACDDQSRAFIYKDFKTNCFLEFFIILNIVVNVALND